jgi:hypothetical protein
MWWITVMSGIVTDSGESAKSVFYAIWPDCYTRWGYTAFLRLALPDIKREERYSLVWIRVFAALRFM